MRNDVKPVIPQKRDPKNRGRDALPLKPSSTRGRGSAFDDEHADPRRRERGDSTDPVGPKPSRVAGTLGMGGAVTDPSGVTGPVSRQNDRLSTTTGSLPNRDLERSARMSEMADVTALPMVTTGTNGLSVPILMALLAGAFALLAFVAWLAWPEPKAYDSDVPNARSLEEFETAE